MKAMNKYPYHAGIKMRFYPSDEQKQIVAINDGASRAVYNKLTGYNKERYQLSMSAASCPWAAARIDYLNSVLRPEGSHGIASAIQNALPFLYEKTVDAQAVANAIKNYNTAWKNCREGQSGPPTFHKKGYEQSYQTNGHYYKDATDMNDSNACFVDAHHMKLPILGKVRISGSKDRIQYLLDHSYCCRIGTITISCDACGRYYVSLQLASDIPFWKELPKTGAVVGVDLNLSNYYTDSNGVVVDNPKYRRTQQKKLAKLQRKVSRKAEIAKKEKLPLRECKNYQKDRRKLAYQHSKIAAMSEQFRDVCSKQLVESQDIIVVEDLRVKNLLHNHKLAMAISEAGWSDFLNKLERKANQYGKTVIRINPAYTTQTCSYCGHIMRGDDKIVLGVMEWDCPNCSNHNFRDKNAAVNILMKGLATLS